jgi:hypothetical protein
MREESVHGHFFCAAGALILTSLSCVAFLAAQPFKPPAAKLQCQVATPGLSENPMVSRGR